jgi:hypothetical protein
VVEVFFGRPLGLDVADDPVLAVPHPEIRVAGLGLLGEGDDVDFTPADGGGTLLKERFQTGVEALLPRVPLAGDIGDGFEVVGQDRFAFHGASTRGITSNVYGPGEVPGAKRR